LLIIDSLLFSKPGRKADIWRNVLKMLVLPVQALILRSQNKNRFCFYHAHAMYYAMLAWLAGVDYIATPQGSEILRRAKQSLLYGYFAGKALRAAKYVTVDSEHMAAVIKQKYGIDAVIIQNGIDIASIPVINENQPARDLIVSIRGMTPLYAIDQLTKARDESRPDIGIRFIYPFYDNDYLDHVRSLSDEKDQWIGRLTRDELYRTLLSTKLVLSIPTSDSSPRSVYEAIFCGSAVAVRENDYLKRLPKCMMDRIIVIDFGQPDWFASAVNAAEKTVAKPFIPDEEALQEFDQMRSFMKILNLIKAV
jgi:hypothetical protein